MTSNSTLWFGMDLTVLPEKHLTRWQHICELGLEEAEANADLPKLRAWDDEWQRIEAELDRRHPPLQPGYWLLPDDEYQALPEITIDETPW